MELTHYEAAGRYLDGVMNGRTGIPLKAWKAEQEKLTAERKELSRRYLALKDEVKEAEQIRKGVYAILREENRKEQPTHKQDLDRWKAERRDGKARPAALLFEGLLAWQTERFHPKYQYECSPLKYVFAPLGICLIALYVLM